MTMSTFPGDVRRNGERVGRGTQRLPSLLRALTGITLGVMAFCAQGATDSSITAGPGALAQAPLWMSPARVELSDNSPRVLVNVHNADHLRAMVVHMQPMIRTQDGIAPHYELTLDVTAHPATFVVAPGASQTVQVALLSPMDSLRGRDFQLIWEAQAEPPGEAYESDARAAP